MINSPNYSRRARDCRLCASRMFPATHRGGKFLDDVLRGAPLLLSPSLLPSVKQAGICISSRAKEEIWPRILRRSSGSFRCKWIGKRRNRLPLGGGSFVPWNNPRPLARALPARCHRGGVYVSPIEFHHPDAQFSR